MAADVQVATAAPIACALGADHSATGAAASSCRNARAARFWRYFFPVVDAAAPNLSGNCLTVPVPATAIVRGVSHAPGRVT
jgi:hypothetical protein